MPVQLEVTQDFHVLPSFAPGICLGLDFITAHRVAIDPARGKAVAGQYTFHVRERMITSHATVAELCLTHGVTLSARSHQWVKVDTGVLTNDVDYAVHPRLSVSEDDDCDVALDRRTPVADAVAARLGDASLETAHAFTLRAADQPPARMLS
ncbi:hypothetical protein OC835_005918 [Tilletia horrida]|nr:hypothetical protein OC835_005918 [Tilletia horrida]